MGFYIDTKTKKTDKITLAVYLLLTVVVFVILFLHDSESNRSLLAAYLITSHLSIYSVFYRGLRKFNYNMIWLGIAGLHILCFFYLKDNPYLMSWNGSNAEGLLYTGVFLILFNFLRFMSLIIMKQEFETVIFAGSSLFEYRKLNWFEWLAAILYMACFIIGITNY